MENKTTYTHEEVIASSLEYFKGDSLAATVWASKYALKDSEGKYYELNPSDMHRRLASEFARIEANYPNPMSEQEIFELLDGFKYIIPGGSVMSSLGSGSFTSLSNCTVIPAPEDKYSSIMGSREKMVQLYKRRCGVGVDISNLRPRGAVVANSANTSTGAASFMEGFSQITNEVCQQGRRGALMQTMNINHPDIKEFILAKQDLTKVTGANISVMVTNEFMRAIQTDKDYILRFPIDIQVSDFNVADLEYETLHTIHNNGKVVYLKKVKARELWSTLMSCAWKTAEPGIVFKDTIDNYSPDGIYTKFRMVGLNPCAEQALGEFDACRLLHSNLIHFVKFPYTGKAYLDYEELYDVFYKAVRLGDDLVDLEVEAMERIINKCRLEGETHEVEMWENFLRIAKEGRRIGLGFTGLADTLARLGITYCSDESFEVVNKIMEIKFKAELDSSIDLAKLRGAFPDWDKDLEFSNDGGNDWYKFLLSDFPEQAEEMKVYGRRNLSISTCAPVGTVSMMTQSSSGIEPVFMPYYERKKKCSTDADRVDFIDGVGEKFSVFVVVHHGLKDYAKITKGLSSEQLDDFKLADWEAIFKESPYFGATSPEISWKSRVKLQGLIQKYITNAISSTVNLPATTTEEEIADIYIEAWKAGNKGQTIYRDTCRDGILTAMASSTSEKKETKSETDESRYASGAKKRPALLDADVVRFKNGGEQWIAFIGMIDGKPYEIFTGKADDSECVLAIPKAITKGKIRKVKNKETGVKCYDFEYTDKDGYTNIVGGVGRIFEDADVLWNYGKMISSVLRHGMPIEQVVLLVKNLKFKEDNINSWKVGVARALGKYVADGTKATGAICPECKQPALVFESGCVTCSSCGYSRC